MSRIGTFGHNQALLNQLLINRDRLGTLQQQVASGKVANNYQGYARDIAALMGTKSVAMRNDDQLKSNTELELKLNHYDTNLRALETVAGELRQQVLNTIAGNSATGMIDTMDNLLGQTISLLNSQLGGRFVFSGTRTDTMPVNITDRTDLLALAATADAFDNNDIKAQAKVDQNTTMTFGHLADDVGEPLLEAFRRIMQFNAGTIPTGAGAYAPAGTFSNPLTENQRQFLHSELAGLEAVVTGLNDIVAQNGINMRNVETVTERLNSEKIFISKFIADIEDVDMGEAVANLRNEETAVEASLNVVARLNNLSLLDFLA